MNLQVKSSLIIIGTLVLGIVLGAVGSSALMRSRFDHLRSMIRPHGMTERLLREIGPLEPGKQDAVLKIFEESEQRVHQELRSGRERIHAIFDSTLAELATILTAEQLERVKNIVGREHEFGFHRKPPPGRPE